VALEVAFSARTPTEASAVFAFDRTEIVEIKSAGEHERRQPGKFDRVWRRSSFLGVDLIYGAADIPLGGTRSVFQRKNVFVGLLSGENTALVVTWPMERLPVSSR